VRPAFGERPGLAVLPFANLSPDPENAYFADGLHEEILASLARAGGLRVISRTSVQEYRDPTRNLREIADALDVSLILEGSVRRVGDEVRLTVQLIDGRSDEHVWTETYDRKVENALELQKVVALQIVSELGASLSPTERRLIEHASPSVPEAYDRYLHALALYAAVGHGSELKRRMSDIERRLSETLERDPAFALAHALRAKTRVQMIDDVIDDDAKDRLGEAARGDIDRALVLQPDLPEALAARGRYHTYVSIDPARGLEDLLRALSIAPNDADSHGIAGMTLRRLGRFDEALVHLERAEGLAPGRSGWGAWAAATLTRLGRYDEADRAWLMAIQRYPTLPNARLGRYLNRFMATGETAGWREEHDRLLRASPGESSLGGRTKWMLICTGDLAGLIALYESASEGELPEPLDYLLGVTHTAAGHPDRARPYLTAVASAPRTPEGWPYVFAAVALELLGRRAEALRLADEAVQLAPEDRDAVNGPYVAILRAWVLIRSGARAEEGYAEFERLVGGFDLRPRWVAAQPEWRLLREDARVQQIIRDKLTKEQSDTTKNQLGADYSR
jgi:TolB-like protein/Flp pilus assembly protein TadD